MKYMIMNYIPPQDMTAPDEARWAAEYALYGAYTKALIDAGVMVGGNGLHPSSTATTLRLQDGKRQVQDGPYAATKDQLGGFYIIEVPDLDTALHWAALNPAASTGAVEVRPVAV
ncbi:YciI family protein [Tabrizicola sp.]|uniref:YciI family protein n=1 Tax=Tabrizicola sp. TaxID=2005166 RepID=UPI003F3B1A06